MMKYALFDTKSNRLLCYGMMTHGSADQKNTELRNKGRSTRWIPQEQIPENADMSMIGLGDLPPKPTSTNSDKK